MDSLSQIVLGAAVGEAAAGKKLGNRAMVWGAFAGTLPDLDVMVNPFISEVDSIAFHRGITHSIFFAIVASFFLAKYTAWLYTSGHYKKRGYKILTTIGAFLFMAFVSFILIFINKFLAGNVGMVAAIVICLIPLFFLGRGLIRNYLNSDLTEVNVSWKYWYKLFFWSILTHPILDSFTAYGTQLFLPFSNYRVALNNISIVDPIYTIPFLILLIVASYMTRNSPKRRFYNWLGIGLSTGYIILTLFNKLNIDNVMETTLAEQQIKYDRYMTAPSLMNNILWSGTVESDSVYYYGMYSMLDKERTFKLEPIKKNHHLLHDTGNDKTLNTVKWFSNNYYSVLPIGDSVVQINDLRYGVRGDDVNNPNDYIFRFKVKELSPGTYELTDQEVPDPEEEREDGLFKKLFTRLRGI